MSCVGEGERGEGEKERNEREHSTPTSIRIYTVRDGPSVLPQIADGKHTHNVTSFFHAMREDRSSRVMCWGPDTQLVGASPPSWEPTGRYSRPSSLAIPGAEVRASARHRHVCAQIVHHLDRRERAVPTRTRKQGRALACGEKTGVSEGWHHHDETS